MLNIGDLFHYTELLYAFLETLPVFNAGDKTRSISVIFIYEDFWVFLSIEVKRGIKCFYCLIFECLLLI